MSISCGAINKRNIYMHSSAEDQHDSIVRMRIDNLHESLSVESDKEERKITSRLRQQMGMFLETLESVGNASRFIDEALVFVGDINKINEGYGDEVMGKLITSILPYANSTALERVKSRLEYFQLSEKQTNKLLNCVQENLVADRILANHERISKRFDIEGEIIKTHRAGLGYMTECVCNMINTYSIRPYQKLNICVEEMTYLLDKNGIPYDKADLVSKITENIILTNEMNLSELKGYVTALTESYCLDEGDLTQVSYITDKPSDQKSIRGYMERFMLDPNKDFSTLMRMTHRIATESSYTDLRNNLGDYMLLLAECYKYDIIYEDGLESCMNMLEQDICERSNITVMDIEKIIENLDTCCKNPILTTKYDLDTDQSKVNKFCQYMRTIMSQFNEAKMTVYDEGNLSVLEEAAQPSKEIVSIDEFKIFRFNNLIKAAFNLDKYLKMKERKHIINPVKKKITRFVRKARHVLFGEDASIDVQDYQDRILEFIDGSGETYKPDVCVAQIPYSLDEEADLKDYLTQVCKEYNYQLDQQCNFGIRSYYIMNPSIAELHVEENVSIALSGEERRAVQEMLTPEMDVYVNLFAESIVNFEKASHNIYTLESYMKEFCSNAQMTEEHLQEAVQILAYLETSDEDLQRFIEMYKDTRARREIIESGKTDMKDLHITYERVEEPFDEATQLEMYNLLGMVLEAAPEIKKPEIGKPQIGIKKPEIKKPEIGKPAEKSDDKKSDDNGDGGEKKFGVNLSGIKMAMEGLRGKMKDMSQQEKELSKNLDNNVRVLAKGMKDALISDRREAIIKGSVIPSFSKCLKIGIALAGAGLITGNPAIPIIAAIGGFAMSKKLTQKERLLLLDDIEVELEVVDKEIQNAESKNQMKKYRALLKYKKDLQRQYQRIKYNVRIGKDIMAGSTVGLKKTD